MWETTGQWLTFAVLFGWAAHAVRSMIRGDRRTIQVIQLVHFAFCGAPLFLDLVVGSPGYTYHLGYIAARSDAKTLWLYLGFILFVPIVFQVAGGRRTADTRSFESPTELHLGRHARRISVGVIVAFLLAVLVSDPVQYFRYGTAIDTTFTARPGYLLVSGLSGLTAVGCTLLLTERTIHWSIRIPIVPILFVAMWVQGKRSVVALTLFSLFFAAWQSGRFRGKGLFAAGVVVVALLGGFSAFYQNEIRSTSTGRRVEALADSPDYVYFRVDYGRDGGIRMAIHAELDPEARPILDYRGESVLFLAAAPVPRVIWPSKPYSYAVYSTSRALGIETREIGWGITTSWLEEAIANFSWFGFLLGPLVPALVCNLGDRRKTAASGLLTAVLASLLLTVNMAAFLPLTALWLVSLIERPSRLSPLGRGATVVRAT